MLFSEHRLCCFLDVCPWVSCTAAPPYCVLRKIVSLKLSFLKCKQEIVTPASWVVVKARSKAESPWHLLSGQEMLPCCLCYGDCGSLKQHFMSGYTNFLLQQIINVSRVHAKTEVTPPMLLSSDVDK